MPAEGEERPPAERGAQEEVMPASREIKIYQGLLDRMEWLEAEEDTKEAAQEN